MISKIHVVALHFASLVAYVRVDIYPMRVPATIGIT